MATKQQVLQAINNFIVANANNEITADVLRPILEDMVEQINDLTGVLSELESNDKRDLVKAINEALQNNSSGVVVHSGSDDPNNTPPGSFAITDFYKRIIGGVTYGLYMYNGDRWVQIQEAGRYFQQAVKVTADDYTMKSDDSIVIGVSFYKVITIFIPDASLMQGRVITLKNHSDNYNINVDKQIKEMNNGAAAVYITEVSPLESIQIVSSGGTWYKIN